jgi:hypothetical protein
MTEVARRVRRMTKFYIVLAKQRGLLRPQNR